MKIRSRTTPSTQPRASDSRAAGLMTSSQCLKFRRGLTPPAVGGVGPVTPVGELRALVVEDEPPLAALVANCLERDGFEV